VTGFLIRLAGPLQSWGEHSGFSDRDTRRFPTRSGIIGILAAAEGTGRGQPLDRYDPLTLTIRVDRPGSLLRDFHTAGGGVPRERSIPTSEGKRREQGKGIVVTRRWYLSDAVFTVAVEGPATLTGEITTALRAPHWQPYLGRRSCPPDQPLLLRSSLDDPVGELTGSVPLPGRRTADSDRITVELITEKPYNGAALAEVNDIPVAFGRYERSYRARAVYRSMAQVPAELGNWPSAASYRKALYEYAGSSR